MNNHVSTAPKLTPEAEDMLRKIAAAGRFTVTKLTGAAFFLLKAHLVSHDYLRCGRRWSGYLLTLTPAGALMALRLRGEP